MLFDLGAAIELQGEQHGLAMFAGQRLVGQHVWHVPERAQAQPLARITVDQRAGGDGVPGRAFSESLPEPPCVGTVHPGIEIPGGWDTH